LTNHKLTSCCILQSETMTKGKRMNSHCKSSSKRRKKNFLEYVSIIRKSSSNQALLLVFSPLSIQVILSIIAAGSEGPTQKRLLDFLQFEFIDRLNSFASKLVSVILKDAAPAGGPRLSFVNGVWVEKTLSIQPSFKQIVSSNYKATLASVDFLTKVCLYVSPFSRQYMPCFYATFINFKPILFINK